MTLSAEPNSLGFEAEHERELREGVRADQPKRILFLDHTALLGGGEIALLNLVRHLDRRYVPVVVLFSEGPLRGKLEAAGVETHLLELDPSVVNVRKGTLGFSSLYRLKTIFTSFWFACRLAMLIRQLKVELVHTNSLKSDLIGGIAAKLARKPLVWHIRDRIDADYLPKSVVFAFRWLCKILPDSVIANSGATLSTLTPPKKGECEPGASKLNSDSRMRIVHDGTLLPDSREMSASAIAPGRRVGLVGRISPWKGQHVFIRAVAQVHERFPDVTFQIIGSAMFDEQAYEAEIRALVAELGLRDCVEFTGFRDDVRRVINELEILVHASTIGEPFGQVVIEGMAAGRSVIATNGGGIPEIVVDGVSGLLVPMGDHVQMAGAMARLLADETMCLRMGLAGLRRVAEFFTIQHCDRRCQCLSNAFVNRRSTAPKFLK